MRVPDRPHESDLNTLARIAREVRLLENRLRNLEEGIAILCSEKRTASNQKSAAAMQEVDILQQSITSLAVFLEALSMDEHRGENLLSKSALRNMPLRDMADRLSGRIPNTSPSGSPELF